MKRFFNKHNAFRNRLCFHLKQIKKPLYWKQTMLLFISKVCSPWLITWHPSDLCIFSESIHPKRQGIHFNLLSTFVGAYRIYNRQKYRQKRFNHECNRQIKNDNLYIIWQIQICFNIINKNVYAPTIQLIYADRTNEVSLKKWIYLYKINTVARTFSNNIKWLVVKTDICFTFLEI